VQSDKDHSQCASCHKVNADLVTVTLCEGHALKDFTAAPATLACSGDLPGITVHQNTTLHCGRHIMTSGDLNNVRSERRRKRTLTVIVP
jgi:hypothetical protein